MRSRSFNLAGHVVLGLMAIYTLVPVVLVLLTSVRPEGDNSTTFGVPDSIELGNFSEAWETAQFSTFMWNSVIVTIGTVIGATLLSVLAGYAFGTMEFRGKNVLFYTFLLSLVLPYESVVISWFYTFREIDQTDTLRSLIVPQMAIYLGFGVFWMRTFFEGVCDSALPAADLDFRDVRPSESVFDAAVAAFLPVCRFGVPVCESAEPAAVLDFVDVALLLSVLDALEAAFLPVVRLFVAIGHTSRIEWSCTRILQQQSPKS